ncbi:MAG: LysR family transcriptional regulator [Acetobacteraceae bacterium]|nr:LysR family transcriptional regulator [Acetobacteraceae bacterium]
MARTDFPGLEAFLAIAERGSFRAAAAHLNLSQTALSHRIRKLEANLGVRLFVRTTRQVSLTAAGREFLGRVRGPAESLADAFAALAAAAAGGGGSIALACLPTLAMRHIPAVLAELAQSHPQVSVRVLDLSAGEIVERVRLGEAELGVGIAAAAGPDLDIQPLLTEPFVLACPADHPLAGRRGVAWAEIEGVPLVRVSPQTGNRALLDDALGPRREAMAWRYEVQHLSTAIALVAARVALAVVPALAVEASGGDRVVGVPLRDPAVSRRLGLITRRGAAPSAAGQALAGLLRARLGRPGG